MAADAVEEEEEEEEEEEPASATAAVGDTRGCTFEDASAKNGFNAAPEEP